MRHDLTSEFNIGGAEMPVDYSEVLREMDAQIAFHEGEVETLRLARPAIVKMRNASAIGGYRISVPAGTVIGKFASMGNQAAVRLLMADGQLRSRDEIYEELRNGGFTSDAGNPVGSIGATLSQMKDELERVEDRWRKKTLTERVQAVSSPEAIPPAPPQFAAPAIAWPPPPPQ